MTLSRLSVRQTSEDGYTLMELLVVLAILGFLAAMATTQVLKYLDRARVGTAKTEVANISSALELYKLDIGRYPTTQEGLVALQKAPPGLDGWNGPYIKKQTAINDPWGHAYHYKSPGEHGDFDLYSDGSSDHDGRSKPLVANW
jgi:general secretion pathway protein G